MAAYGKQSADIVRDLIVNCRSFNYKKRGVRYLITSDKTLCKTSAVITSSLILNEVNVTEMELLAS